MTIGCLKTSTQKCVREHVTFCFTEILGFDKVSLSVKRNVKRNFQIARIKAISPLRVTYLKVFLPYYLQPTEGIGKFSGEARDAIRMNVYHIRVV